MGWTSFTQAPPKIGELRVNTVPSIGERLRKAAADYCQQQSGTVSLKECRGRESGRGLSTVHSVSKSGGNHLVPVVPPLQ